MGYILVDNTVISCAKEHKTMDDAMANGKWQTKNQKSRNEKRKRAHTKIVEYM